MVAAYGLVFLREPYRALVENFQRHADYIPTRFYTDVVRIKLQGTRSAIETRLTRLGYVFQRWPQTLGFTLHPVDYPPFLSTPEPTLGPSQSPLAESSAGSGSAPPSDLAAPDFRAAPAAVDAAPVDSERVVLEFDRPGPEGRLRSLQRGAEVVSEVVLEPEVFATLSPRGSLHADVRHYLSFSEIPAPFWKAVIAIEDQHFLDHRGFDPRGLARAIAVDLKTFSFAQGGSTLTQQLVKNLMARRGKNLVSKLNELVLSVLLELRFEKEAILERYLNEVYLGQLGNFEIHGISEAARSFFDQEAADLNQAEAALLAGLIRGPTSYSPYRSAERSFERMRLVLRKMHEVGFLASEELDEALQTPPRLAPVQSTLNQAPYFSDYVKVELAQLLGPPNPASPTEAPLGEEPSGIESGLRVYTTLDPILNQLAQDAISQGIQKLEKTPKGARAPQARLEGALAAADAQSGAIRALVGGRSYLESNFNRILNMKRQVGSAFKPVVYLSALRQQHDPQGHTYGPGLPLLDAPFTWDYENHQSWTPRNYDRKFRGWISLRQALAQSINTITARLGQQVGLRAIIETAQLLGIDSSLPSVPALTLGIAELSPLEVLRAYSTLARGGARPQFQVIRAVTQAQGEVRFRAQPHATQTLDPALCELMNDLLTSVLDEGTARAARRMGFLVDAAGKTGTTSNYRDAWFAGFTPDLVSVVWLGTEKSQTLTPTMKLTGANSALPVWVRFNQPASALSHHYRFDSRLTRAHLHRVLIDKKTGERATPECPPSQVLVENYIEGLEPAEQTCASDYPPLSTDELH